MSKISLVIFDWDGTVMDSVGRIVSSMRNAAALTGITVPDEHAVKQIIGLSLEPALNCLFPDANEMQRQSLFEHYRDQYVEHNPTPAPLFAGAQDVLQQLRQRNMLLAVATGKARKGLHRVFEQTGLAPYFATTRCADEAQSKPHPDMLQQILLELNIRPEHAVMVGDTSHDMKMAQSAGVPGIGITHGVHGRDVLQQFSPVAIIDSLPQLLDVL